MHIASGTRKKRGYSPWPVKLSLFLSGKQSDSLLTFQGFCPNGKSLGIVLALLYVCCVDATSTRECTFVILYLPLELFF